MTWDDKAPLLPFGDCGALVPDGVPCRPCRQSADCAPEGDCVRLGDTGRFCTLPCDAAADGGDAGADADAAACPAGFVCAWLPETGGRCVPAPGEVLVSCETAQLGLVTSPAVDPGPGRHVGDDGTYDLWAAPLETAVVCVASQAVAPGGPLVPALLGVRRHVVPPSGGTLEGQDVVLDIPLRTPLRARLVDAPADPPGGEWTVDLFLDFGGEGVWWMDQVVHDGVVRPEIRFAHTPAALAGPLDGASYALRAVRTVAGDEQESVGQVTRQDVTDTGSGRLLRWGTAGCEAEPLGAPADVHALATDPSGRLVAAGGGGLVLHREGDAWHPEATRTGADLSALWSDGAGGLWAAGQDGVVLRRGAGDAWERAPGLPDVTWLAIAGRPGGPPLVAGDAGLAGWLGPDGFRPIDTETDRALRAVAVAAEDGETAWLAGDDGVVRRVVGAAVDAADLPEPATVHALVPLAGGALLALGDAGRAWRREAGAWWPESTGAARALRAGVPLPGTDGAAFVVGDDGTALWRAPDGTWLAAAGSADRDDLRAAHVDAAGVVRAGGLRHVALQPVLGIPGFTAPAPGGVWRDRTLAWAVPPSAPPSLQVLLVWPQPDGFPAWVAFLAPHLDRWTLPSPPDLGGLDPLGERHVLELRHLWHPALHIDRFRDRYISSPRRVWPASAGTRARCERPS